MKESNVRRLPVVEEGELVGIVTKYDLLEASPSPATSLSVYELNYLLAKMPVRRGQCEERALTSSSHRFPDDAIGPRPSRSVSLTRR